MDNESRKKEFIDTMHYRHASKEFDPNKKIPEDDFMFILEAGRLSPSAIGSEPWQFVVLQDMNLRMFVADNSLGAKRQMPTASHVVMILARKDIRYDSDYLINLYANVKKVSPDILEQIPIKYKIFQEDEIQVLGSEKTLWDWASKQTYIALGNMMTAAAFIGIDSCAIEGFYYAKVREEMIKQGVFDPNIFDISVIVAFGYRVKEPRPKVRRPIEDIVTVI